MAIGKSANLQQDHKTLDQRLSGSSPGAPTKVSRCAAAFFVLPASFIRGEFGADLAPAGLVPCGAVWFGLGAAPEIPSFPIFVRAVADQEG
jgi:hypothetical protein